MAENRSRVDDLLTSVRSTVDCGVIWHVWVKHRFVDHGAHGISAWEPVRKSVRTWIVCAHFSTMRAETQHPAKCPVKILQRLLRDGIDHLLMETRVRL